MSKPRKKKRSSKRVLALPDLEQSRASVLNSLTSESGHRTYDHAIIDFVDWYCSEPRLAFNRTVVLRYRIYLEQKKYAPTTINLRLAAVRRVAFEAADSDLLSPELAAGIRRVKGVRRIGVRVGNWPDRRAGQVTARPRRSMLISGQEELRDARDAHRVRASPVRVGAPDGGATAKKGRPLDHCRPDRRAAISERCPFRIGSNHPWTLGRRLRESLVAESFAV